MTDIMEQIGLPALLEQLAEECGELTHACLKFARCLRGENPTPKTEKECRDALTEEVADVTLCIRLIIEGYVIDPDKVNDIVEEKMQRWHERLEEAEEKPSAQPERKTGRWIPCPQNASWLYVYKCSECGGYLQISDVDGIGITAKYCSYCGAKMEGGDTWPT